MKTFEKILCPVDFSDYTQQSLQLAASLASQSAVIHMLYVVVPQIVTDPGGFVIFESSTELMRKSAEELMQKKTIECKTAFPHLNWIGSIEISSLPATAIVDFQNKEKSDLIVMGTHGRSGLSRWIMGSVAESVLRHCNCPVLFVKKS